MFIIDLSHKPPFAKYDFRFLWTFTGAHTDVDEITLVRQYIYGCCGTYQLLLMQRTDCGNKMATRGYSEDVSIEMVVVYMLLAKREA